MQATVDDHELHDELTSLLKNVSPSGRRKMSKVIALQLRANQSDQILANKDPSGKSFKERKSQKRKGAKRGKMFKKLGRRRSLSARYNAAEALINFRGHNLGIAKTHQDGGFGVVNKQGLKIRYPERKLLGISKKDRELVRDTIIGVLAEG